MPSKLTLYPNDLRIIESVRKGNNYPAAISNDIGLPRRTLYSCLKRLAVQGIIRKQSSIRDTRKTIITLVI
jgi:uncharacterized membrane protein